MSSSETAAASSTNKLSANEPGANDPDELKSKNRFGLGSIFMLIFTIALGLAWFTQVMLLQDRLRKEAQQVFATYGGMGYSHDWTPWGISVSLDFRNSPITSTGLKDLAGNPVVVKLDLSGTQITDADLKILANAEALESVRLAETEVSEQALAALRAARPDLEIILE